MEYILTKNNNKKNEKAYGKYYAKQEKGRKVSEKVYRGNF